MTETDKSELNSKVEKLKESHKNENLIDIEKYSKELTDVWNKISTRLYQEAPKEQNEQQQSNQQSNQKDDIQDVDFEEVK